jgi:predicted RNase H-like nuclease (RuvC/YqgF family)
MSCEICGRNSCTRSFHSIEEQEAHDESDDDKITRLERELTATQAELARLKAPCQSADELHARLCSGVDTTQHYYEIAADAITTLRQSEARVAELEHTLARGG